MANYTMELYDIMRHPIFEVFDFEYDFYTDDVRIIENFEKKFINHYAFYEINNKVVYKWKWQLKSKLDLIMPYYKQLYETELKAKDIDFLLNKDYREEFIREVDKELVEKEKGTENKNINTNSTSNTNGNSSSNRKTTNQNEINNKSSDVNNGNAKVGLTQDYLTGVSRDEESSSGTEELKLTNAENETKNTNIGENTTNSADKNTDEKLVEKTVLTGKGNIGVTSSAELLEKWRDVIINIDKMIIEELRDLFLLVY